MVVHPYVPIDLNLPEFVPNFLPASSIVGIFVVASIIVVTLAWILPDLFSKTTKCERLLICWWTFTGLTHAIIEAYFVLSPEFYKDKTGCFLAEVWKEYSKGDSRYAGRHPAVVGMEGITAVIEGPTSLIAAYAIATHKPYSCVLQLAISLGQLYGCLIYYVTAILEGDNFAASPYYYYAYYIAANAAWVVIPALISISCWRKICKSFEVEGKTKSKT